MTEEQHYAKMGGAELRISVVIIILALIVAVLFLVSSKGKADRTIATLEQRIEVYKNALDAVAEVESTKSDIEQRRRDRDAPQSDR